MKTPTKALSIKQPWASLIAHGIKNIENRTWSTKFRGRIYIHASGTPQTGSYRDFVPSWTDLLESDKDKIIHTAQFRGAIIGEVDIVDCVINHPSTWAEFTEGVAYNPKHYPNGVRTAFGYKGCVYNWVLANAVIYDEPILNVKGKLSLWEFQELTNKGL